MITREQLSELKLKVIEAEKEFNSALNKFIIQRCPFSVGDVAKVHGNRHYAKDMVVDKIYVKDEPFRDELVFGIWVVKGRVLKTDGTPSKIEVKFSQFNYEYYKPYIDRGATLEEATNF